jgi:hypothetical protein
VFFIMRACSMRLCGHMDGHACVSIYYLTLSGPMSYSNLQVP